MKKTVLTACMLLCGASAFAVTRIFVANDLGRNGAYLQKPIAALMGSMAEKMEPEAVMALGDTHHYMGVQSVEDPLWMTNYELIYDHPELQVPWYPVLGNHEYRGNAEAMTAYSAVSRRWEMPARYYSRVFEDDGTTLRVIFIDTVPLIDKYRGDKEDYPDVAAQDMEAQLAWLESELAGAREDWVCVAGHHPVYADTPKEASERTDMQRRVEPILRRHGVDMYICGHIHNFQHIRDGKTGIDYVVNSSGSLSREDVKDVPGTVFRSGEAGFSILEATPDSLTLTMISSEGVPLHKVVRRK